MIAEQQWIIAHPGTQEPIECESFEQAMKDYFEGHNLPYLVTDGVKEPFDLAYARVKIEIRKAKK